MTKHIKITRNAWTAFIITLIASFIMVSVSHAQTASSSGDQLATRYGVTFPITALGNCTDLNSCKTFCDDPINKNTCIAFAKSKGFYKEDALTIQKEAVLTKAKTTLGCDSETSCLNFCQIPANYDKCSTFAQSNNLQGGVVQKPDGNQILEKAKQVLGCTSIDSCKSFCSNSANQQKCADFAKQTGLRGGEEKIGPGGCTSEETCRTFCSDPGNYQICASFTHSSGGTFSGPGGCNSPESCKTYCQQNPSACTSFGGTSSQSGFSPAETCNRTPNCSWTGSACFCGNANADTNSNGQASQDNTAATCVRYGCTYTGNSCQCQNIGNTYNLDDAKQGCELGKGTWTGSFCNMSPGSSPYSGGASYQQQESVCKSGGGTCASGSTTNFCNCQNYQTPQYSPYPQPSNSSQNYNSQYSCASTVCSNGYAPDPGKNCACAPVSVGAPQSCQPPSGGCGSNSYYDYSRCGCYQNGSTPNSPPSPGSSSCQPPSGGCGTNSYYDYSRCGCYQNNQTTPATGSCQPPSGGCGSNSYYDYSRCGCYQNGSTLTTTSPTSGSCPAGQYWNGSGCLNSNTAPQNSTAPTSTSQPAPAQTSAPQPTTPPPSTPQPSPAVKGISIGPSIWTWLINLFSK